METSFLFLAAGLLANLALARYLRRHHRVAIYYEHLPSRVRPQAGPAGKNNRWLAPARIVPRPFEAPDRWRPLFAPNPLTDRQGLSASPAA